MELYHIYICELICLTIGLWILLNTDFIINFSEPCSCHCSCCVIHNNNIYMLWCNTQQQQQQQQQQHHNKIIKKLTEICYRKKCMTDLCTCSTPNDTIHKVTTDISSCIECKVVYHFQLLHQTDTGGVNLTVQYSLSIYIHLPLHYM